MTTQHQPIPALRALLIGIDCYMPNLLPDGTYYRSLAGCVRDILQAENFLRGELGLTDQRLTRLTASRPGRDNQSSRSAGGGPSPGSDEKPTEPPEQWPTYHNIVQAFRKLEESAQPGEQIYIHYSGHGGRVKTLPAHRELISHKIIDEALVPTDLGSDEGQYLRDIELAFLLQKLVNKGLYVTIVLDSCHSGSATRLEGSVRGQAIEPQPNVRGSSTINTLPKPSLVAGDEELVQNWLRLWSPIRRGFEVGSAWLPDPRGYVLLAACRVHEGAHEHPFDGVHPQGALTYWLLDALKKFGNGATYRTLHRYIHAKVSGQFRKPKETPQNPQLEGEGDRVVFGCEPIHAPQAFVVLDTDHANSQVTLSGGRAHGLSAGARFAIYSAGQVEFKQSEKRSAIAQIIEPGITSSPAQLVNQRLGAHVEQGDWAVLLMPGTDTPRFIVTVLAPEGATPESTEAVAIGRLVNLLKRHNEGYVRLADGHEPADFIVTVNPDGNFLICDSQGKELPNIGTVLSLEDPSAPQVVVERLLHLAKYRSVRELRNLDPMSSLARKFSLELLGVQSDYKPGTAPHARPLADMQELPTVKVGEWIFLRARNHYPVKEGLTLNVTVLDLRPDWSIRQVFPSRSGLFETLEPQQELPVPLGASLPRDYEEGIDVIKFFATVEPTDFHFLELPPLDQTTRAATEETLSSQILRSSERAAGKSQTRDMVVPLGEHDDWCTRQLEFRVTR